MYCNKNLVLQDTVSSQPLSWKLLNRHLCKYIFFVLYRVVLNFYTHQFLTLNWKHFFSLIIRRDAVVIVTIFRWFKSESVIRLFRSTQIFSIFKFVQLCYKISDTTLRIHKVRIELWWSESNFLRQYFNQ